MFRPHSREFKREIEDLSFVYLTIKPGWENSDLLSSTPSLINIQSGPEQNRLFECYVHSEPDGGSVTVCKIKPTGWMEKQDRATEDLYISVALKGLKKYASIIGASQLIVDSKLKGFPEALLENNFEILQSSKNSNSYQGYLVLRQK